MAFNYACFISYCHGQHDLVKTFVSQLVQALKNEVDAHLDEGVYIDEERLKPGYMFNDKLAEAICQSVCMIVIYSPKYDEHTYCLREYTAMEVLESRRMQALGQVPARGEGLIIPIIFRGEVKSLPPKIRDHRQFCDFSGYTLASEEISRNKTYAVKIQEIVQYIKKQRDRLKNIQGICDDCSTFNLPDENQITWKGELSIPEFPLA